MTSLPSMLTLIDTASETVRQSLISFVEKHLDGNSIDLSADLVSTMTRALDESFKEAGREALRAFLEQFDCSEEVIERDGRTYRLKNSSVKKSFLTIFGSTTIARRYYYDRTGKKGLVPLDERWAMSGRYATPEIVEKALWVSGSLVASETSDAMKRLCGLEISTSCIQDVIQKDGGAMATMLEGEEKGVALREIKVPEDTEVFVASLDGANVLMRKKGVGRGRHAQRPRLQDASESEEDGKNNTSYKNAMVGSFSFYETVEGVIDIENSVEGLRAHRLSSVYNARMPEDKAVGFKNEFERMVLVGNVTEESR